MEAFLDLLDLYFMLHMKPQKMGQQFARTYELLNFDFVFWTISLGLIASNPIETLNHSFFHNFSSFLFKFV